MSKNLNFLKIMIWTALRTSISQMFPTVQLQVPTRWLDKIS